MLLNLDGRKIYFDLAGPQNAPTVCFTHSLAADGGMWTEQLVPLLAAGYRVLRLDMRVDHVLIEVVTIHSKPTGSRFSSQTCKIPQGAAQRSARA